MINTMNKVKRYLENHPGATIEDYENQRHRMHIIQARAALLRTSSRGFFKGKHTGSKNRKKLLSIIKYVCNKPVKPVGSY